jgi:multisubunit Na+/H+ antiporter MnhG subunit
MNNDHEEYKRKTDEENKSSWFGIILIVLGFILAFAFYEAGLPFIGFVLLILLFGGGISFILK